MPVTIFWNEALPILYVGKRDDKDFSSRPSRDLVTDDYVTVNLSGSFDICEHFQVFGHIENFFDKKYYESYGYGTAGFSAYGGMKINF
jgi:vitamin B12 transporter